MTASVQSLWPAQIRSRVQSPWAILSGQAEALGRLTSGVLLGEVKRRETDAGRVILGFDIVVPALNEYRHRIMNVVHDSKMFYPASVDAEIFRNGMPELMSRFGEELALQSIVEEAEKSVNQADKEAKKPVNRADSDQEFIDLVARVLKSAVVVSAAQSLIARANDVLAEKEVQAKGITGDDASPAPEPFAEDPPNGKE